MRKIKAIIANEPFDYMVSAGRWNPCVEIIFNQGRAQHRHKIKAGSSDEILVYREGSLVYVLNFNQRLPYIGLEVFDGNENVGNVFFQGDQVQEALGNRNKSPFATIRRLLEYI